jgi:hypothetical protein
VPEVANARQHQLVGARDLDEVIRNGDVRSESDEAPANRIDVAHPEIDD